MYMNKLFSDSINIFSSSPPAVSRLEVAWTY